jgi:hypothetical protein
MTADPTHPAQLHIGSLTVALPMPEAGDAGIIRFPAAGADGPRIWVDHVSEDWLAVAFLAVLRAQVREADDRTARQVPRRRTA